jgi:hypothetical protein
VSGIARWSLAISRQIHMFVRRVTTVLIVVLIACVSSSGYSVLTHEEIVDLVWTSEIRPLLLKRYPQTTPDQIIEAHGYAYGGAVIQDLGYYPFGNREFSDLVHYARTGDFVRELILQSQDVNEYAFALGALSHYASDIAGHLAVNQAVSMQYPKLRAKYGMSVRFAEDKTAHLKTEFGFDMVQVAKNRYASQQYHDFIGFEVSKSLLERVFPVVYGVELNEVLTHETLAVGTYRYSVSRLIPQMTQVALQTHKKNMMRETPNLSKKKFLYRLSRSGYEKEWGKDYTKPGFGTRIMSTLLRFMPKIGPFKGMAFNNPTARTEDLYFKSINATVDEYRVFLEQVRVNSLVLPNLDLDSGDPIIATEYSLADETYAKLLERISDRKFDLTSSELRDDVLHFYSAPSAANAAKNERAPWQNIQTSLLGLKAIVPVKFVKGIKVQPPIPVEASPKAAMVVPTPEGIIIGFVGGMISHTNLVHSEVQLASKLRGEYPIGVAVETFESYRKERAFKTVIKYLDKNHDGSLSDVEKQSARIIIYGHSWGGSEAIELARDLGKAGIPVRLTIQIDSIAKFHRDDAVIPDNVIRAVNFYQPNGFLRGEPRIRAANDSRTEVIGNYRIDYAGAPYGCNKYPWYDHLFVKAHTQIECDPEVWKQVEILIRADLAAPARKSN